jgi:hypothetical protein
MHFILKHWDPMIGVDYHIPWPPGSPAPLPSPVPYMTMQLLNGIVPTVFSKPIMTHLTAFYGVTMEKGTDIGTMIPHIGPPSLTLVVEMVFSASKSHWGSARYKAEGKVIGCALLVSVNPNLNCGTPAPTPTGFVVCVTTHATSMSLGDILAGICAMAMDALMQFLLNKLGGAIGDRLTNSIMRRIGPSTWVNAFCSFAGRSGAGAAATAAVARQAASVGRVVGPAVGFFLGGPLGMDVATFTGWSPGGAVSGGLGGLADSGGQALGDWIDPPPPVGDYNNGAGAPPVAN